MYDKITMNWFAVKAVACAMKKMICYYFNINIRFTLFYIEYTMLYIIVMYVYTVLSNLCADSQFQNILYMTELNLQ